MKSPTTLLYITAILLAGIATLPLPTEAQIAVRWHDEQTDTTRINTLLREVAAKHTPTANQKVAALAALLVDTHYVAGTLEGSPEMLTVNMEEMDCTTFVETVAALALALEEQRDSWQDFVYNLEQLRYRQGRVDGYASRLHYVSDWIVDNTHRGNLSEVTDRIPGASYQVKTLDYMSRHRSDYPAMTDDETFEKIKNAEVGFRSHRFPVLKTALLQSKKAATLLREGDILAFTTKTEGLDVSHLGIVTMKNGVPHIIHASSTAGKVIVDPLPLADYLRRNHTLTGARVIRLGSLR